MCDFINLFKTKFNQIFYFYLSTRKKMFTRLNTYEIIWWRKAIIIPNYYDWKLIENSCIYNTSNQC